MTAAVQKGAARPKKKSMLLETLARTVKAPSAKLGAVLFILMVLVCIIGPFLSPYDIADFDLLNMKAAPSLAHPWPWPATRSCCWPTSPPPPWT